MQELESEDSMKVSGGIWPLVAILAFVYHERNNIKDFVEGAFEGMESSKANH
jgi:hypothetical protein